MTTNKVIHKYDEANFTNYLYNQVQFVAAGAYTINGTVVNGNDYTSFDIVVKSTPIHISGGTELYLVGTVMPNLLTPGDGQVGYSNAGMKYDGFSYVSGGTQYYHGNIGQGSGNGYFN